MWIELLLAAIGLFYVINKWKLNYWGRRGVFQVEPSFLFGNMKDIFFEKTLQQTFFTDLYKKYKHHKLVGFYGFYKPILFVTDPELVKQVIINDFNSFAAGGADANFKTDPMMAINPFLTHDLETWRARRGLHVANLTPAKLKGLPECMLKVGENMMKYIKQTGGPVKVKELGDFLAMETVVSFSFGYEPTVFADPENAFRKHASDSTLFERNYSRALNSYFFYPFLAHLLSYRTISQESQDFFVSMVNTMIDHRKKNLNSKASFIDHLFSTNTKLIQQGSQGFSDIELAGHCMTVYMDSYITTASSFAFLILNLCEHQGIQDNIREEILSIGKNMEDFDYEKIHSIQTLEAALKESLRLHSPLAVSSRTCSKDTELGGIEIEKGTRVVLPYSLFHTDAEYFPDPESFKPERFKPGESIVKSAYLPFGDGPRMCLGSKYAQLVIKTGIVYILLNFKIVPSVDKKNACQEYVISNIITPDDKATVKFQPIHNIVID